jgi:hypothetical protein
VHRVLLLCTLALVTGHGAGAQQPDAVSKLKREGRVACEPSGAYFCVNMHVSCAGRTAVPTFPFSLRVTPAGAALEAPPRAEAFVERYARGRVEWSSDGHYVIVRPASSNGYIKLFQDGMYVFRHYPQAEGIMSRGTCA